jgi:long-chain fatty acid transport protein
MNQSPVLRSAIATASILALGAGMAQAAGIERGVPSTRVLFKDGRYVEVSAAYVSPDLSGRGADLTALGATAQVPGSTGDLLESYWQFGFALKTDLTDRISFALIGDDPWGADTKYGRGSFPAGPFPPIFSYDGTTANLDSYALSGIIAYDVTPAVKLYAGLRAQWMEADASIPFVGPTAPPPFGPRPDGYTVDTNSDWGFGYMLGGAYQIPDMALRVALTYYSKIEHKFDTREFGDSNTRTDIETPQAVNLEFQSGVAANTLVFGSIRWVDWSDFAIEPPLYKLVTGRALVDYESDWWTYTLGVGYQFNEAFAGSVSLAHEPQTDDVLTTLGPIDGRTTLSLGGTSTRGAVEFAGGVSYSWLGSTENILETDYSDGDAFGLGLRVGYNF